MFHSFEPLRRTTKQRQDGQPHLRGRMHSKAGTRESKDATGPIRIPRIHTTKNVESNDLVETLETALKKETNHSMNSVIFIF